MNADIRNFGLSLLCTLTLWAAACTELPKPFPEAFSNLFPTTCIWTYMNMRSAPHSQQIDPELVTRAAQGNRTAFAELYQHFGKQIFPMLWRLSGGDRARTEDWVQDTFVSAWSKLHQLREPAAFGGWLKTMALNLALADKRRLKPVLDDNLPEQAAAEPPWPAADRDLECAIARLPERARQVLVLFHVEGLAHQEIATLLKIETGTSKAQLHRARGLLREMLA